MTLSPEFFDEYKGITFIPPEERWEEPKDNTVRDERREYFVTVLCRSCDEPHCNQGNCNEHSDNPRDYQSMKVTRNFESRVFTLYVGGKSVLSLSWADTPSGRGPNGHKKRLNLIKMFARGWMAAEEEVPVQDIHLHSYGPEEP